MRTCKIVTVVSLVVAGSAGAETGRQARIRVQRSLRSFAITKVKSIRSYSLDGLVNTDVREVRLGRVRALFRRPASDRKAWDAIPANGFAVRELAAYRSAVRLGLDRVVPTTVARRVEGERGTLQHWITGKTDHFASLHDQRQLKKIIRYPKRGRRTRRRLTELAQQVNWDSVHEMLILDYIIQQNDRHGGNIIFQRRPNRRASVYAIDNELAFVPFELYSEYQFDGHALALMGAELLGKTRLSDRVRQSLKSVDVPRWTAELRRLGIQERRIRVAVDRLERVKENGLRAVYSNPVLSGWKRWHGGSLLKRARELFSNASQVSD